jgi:predicted nucleic acid-binding protein
MEIIPVGSETVEIFGLLKADLASAGTPLDDFDLIIASIAMAHNQVLVTNNEKHFRRINGLKMENWVKAY